MSYLTFEFAGFSDSGKTERVLVKGSNGGGIGVIYWHGPWRKYIFQPIGNPIFDHVCLNEIGDYLYTKTYDHKAMKQMLKGTNANE